MISYNLSCYIKICDCYNGKPIEKALVISQTENLRFNEKGNGFYIAVNSKSNVHIVNITAGGYKSKTITADLTENREITVFLVPELMSDSYLVRGSIKSRAKPVCGKSFYYFMEDNKYKGVLRKDTEQGADRIAFHIYNNISLEGRKVLVTNNKTVHRLGSFDYMDKEYALMQKFSGSSLKGENIYVLFEEQTDSEGYFELIFPKYLINQNECTLYFMFGSKICEKRIEFYKNKANLEIKI